MSIELAVLISICLLGAAPVLFIRARHAPVLQTAASLLALVLGLDIARSALLPPPGTRAPAPGLLYGFLRVDPLAAIMIVLVTSVCFLTALVALSRSRARFETSGERTKTQRLRRLAESKEPRRIAILSLLFEASLIVVVSCDNLGFLWIGLETAALLGALLVGSRGGANAVGAALKYVLLGGAGLVIALLGTALVYKAGESVLGEGNRALSFQLLQARGAALGQPVVVRLAFVCALVGYGAKVGFFPLHAWKADAYTATTPPAAGLLAGASVAASLVPILRFALIARAAGQEAFVDSLLRTVGAGSFLAATAFVIRERDIVRILAYTSIEQMGLCAAAFGLGAQGTRAGLLQLFGNAILKALAFGLAGEVARARGHSSIDLGKGISGSAPSLAAAYVVVIFAALGFPPFGLFTSELLMVGTAFSSGHEVLAALLALCLAIAFAAVAINALRAVFERADDQVPSWRFRKTLLVGTAISLTGSALAGSFMPRELFDSLLQVASGGTP